MAAVDTATKEMEALHVGQNGETKVSNCSSAVFHGPWNESLVLFLCKHRAGLLWHLFEKGGGFFAGLM